MSAIDPPLCRLCGKTHWQRAGCDFGKNTSREGRRALKAEAARPDATRLAATAKPSPPSPPTHERVEKQTKAEKAGPGKPKTARKGKKK